jgi:hypothetical protein
MSATTYLANKVLDHVLRATTYTAPAAVYAALFTTAPGVGGTGTEVSGNSYARVAATFSAAASGATSNSGTVTFPTPTGSWGTVTHFAIYDASTSGNMLAFGTLTASKSISSGDSVTFEAAALTATLT